MEIPECVTRLEGKEEPSMLFVSVWVMEEELLGRSLILSSLFPSNRLVLALLEIQQVGLSGNVRLLPFEKDPFRFATNVCTFRVIHYPISLILLVFYLIYWQGGISLNNN
jgi:hypothetical protein